MHSTAERSLAETADDEKHRTAQFAVQCSHRGQQLLLDEEETLTYNYYRGFIASLVQAQLADKG